MKAIIIIPAYNEASRIERTIRTHHTFFSSPTIQQHIDCSFIIVPNGCTDNTQQVVNDLSKEFSNITSISIEYPGKGRAIKEGFLYTMQCDCDFIGFIDADGATSPEALYALFQYFDDATDGVIASRYMHDSNIFPPRPRIKRWGSKLVYEPLVRTILGIKYHDLQCGAKLFKKNVINVIAPLLTIDQWAFDIELLYLCHQFNFFIKEVPTIWHDQKGSTLKIRSGWRMLTAIFDIKAQHKHLS